MDVVKAISDSLEISADILFDIPRIVMIGDMKVHIENYTALLEYKKDNIKLKYKSGVIEICGQDFEIKIIGEGNIVISGKIGLVKLI